MTHNRFWCFHRFRNAMTLNTEGGQTNGNTKRLRNRICIGYNERTSVGSYFTNRRGVKSVTSWIRGVRGQLLDESETCEVSYFMNQRHVRSVSSWIRGVRNQLLHESEFCEISYFMNQGRARSAISSVRDVQERCLDKSVVYFINDLRYQWRVGRVSWGTTDVLDARK
jgi:hypothetical protein